MTPGAELMILLESRIDEAIARLDEAITTAVQCGAEAQRVQAAGCADAGLRAARMSTTARECRRLRGMLRAERQRIEADVAAARRELPG